MSIFNTAYNSVPRVMTDDEFTLEPPPEPIASGDGGHSFTERIFGALASKRRRYVLYCLQDHDQMTVETLAHQIAAWEEDSPIEDVPEDVFEQVLTSLMHSQLPKLEDYGLIEYDERSGAVRYTEASSLLEDALSLAALLDKPDP